MKIKKIIGLILVVILLVGMVGCRGYNVKNKDIYNKGYYRFAVSDNINIIDSDYEFYDVIYNTINYIQDDNMVDIEIKGLDSNYLYSVKVEDLNDYEYGMLQFAIDRTKEEKRKDLYFIYQIGTKINLKNDTKERVEMIKIIKKYNNAYVECYDELLELLEEIENKYGKEDIPKDYLDKVNNIRRKQENILNGFSEEVMTKYTKLFKKNFN